jgi:hypothetical protein
MTATRNSIKAMTKEIQNPNGNICNVIREVIINHPDISFPEFVERVKSQSGHNSPVRETNPDPLPEKRIIASVEFSNAKNTKPNKCLKCGKVYSLGKGQNKLCCRKCCQERTQMLEMRGKPKYYPVLVWSGFIFK